MTKQLPVILSTLRFITGCDVPCAQTYQWIESQIFFFFLGLFYELRQPIGFLIGKRRVRDV